jgi:hypothetical protein
MSNHLVEWIKKYAQNAGDLPPPPPPPKGRKPKSDPGATTPGKGQTPAKPGAPPNDPNKPKPTGPNAAQVAIHSKAIASIKEMQLAMQQLSESVVTDSESGTMANKSRDASQPLATDQVKTSKKSFNDFIAEQYVGTLDEDKKGVEWSKDTKITTLPGKQKTQTDIYELDAVMDTLRRVGLSSREFKIDGNWEFRTDNALKNMMGFGYALLQLAGDFGLDNNIYTYDNWKDFYNNLSGYKIDNGIVKLSPAEKSKRADKITKHLKAITKLYSHFRQQVTARPEYRPYIEGKRSFDKYDQTGNNKDTLTPFEEQMAATDVARVSVTYDAPALPAKKLDYIPLKALRTKQDYLDWMMKYAGYKTEEEAINIFNTVIKPKIDTL